MFYMNYPRCGDCAYSHISFIRECTDARDVSYGAEEGVELTVHNESKSKEKGNKESGRVISSCILFCPQNLSTVSSDKRL